MLLGASAAFRALGSWSRWLVSLKAVYGLPLTPSEAAIFQRHTGRDYSPPPGGWPEVVCVVGRQSGKGDRTHKRRFQVPRTSAPLDRGAPGGS
jgi:hypothetical protein